jgi:hypothetical protein
MGVHVFSDKHSHLVNNIILDGLDVTKFCNEAFTNDDGFGYVILDAGNTKVIGKVDINLRIFDKKEESVYDQQEGTQDNFISKTLKFIPNKIKSILGAIFGARDNGK